MTDKKFIIQLDGDMWCAYQEPFTNIQECDAGFGHHPTEAIENLLLKKENPYLEQKYTPPQVKEPLNENNIQERLDNHFKKMKSPEPSKPFPVLEGGLPTQDWKPYEPFEDGVIWVCWNKDVPEMGECSIYNASVGRPSTPYVPQSQLQVALEALENIAEYWNGARESSVDAIETATEIAKDTLRKIRGEK